MSLDRPWALALLAVPVLLLWLRLRAARPREAEASSLLVWSKVSSSDTLSAKPRPPLAAWIEALGAALIALGLAGPTGRTGTARDRVFMIQDSSPSMRVRTSWRGEPVDRMGFACRAAAQGGVSAGGPCDKDPGPVAVAESATQPVVVITDHRIPGLSDIPGQLWVTGIGQPCFNAGITAASGVPLPDGRWRLFLEVEAFGSPGPVEGTLTIGSDVSKITVQPGRPLEVVREVAAGRSEVRIEFKGDALPEDDVISLREGGGAEVWVVDPAGGFRGTPLARALGSAGATMVARIPHNLPSKDRKVDTGPALVGDLGGRTVRLVLPLGPSEIQIGEPIRGSSVVLGAHEVVRDVRIDPSCTLGMRYRFDRPYEGPPSQGIPLISDESGPLLVFDGKSDEAVMQFTFLPGGTWVERDPSFVVFAKNLVEYAAGGPARIEATGLLDPRETREAAEGETFGDPAQALREAARPDPASRASFAFPLLLAGALILAAAWLSRSY